MRDTKALVLLRRGRASLIEAEISLFGDPIFPRDPDAAERAHIATHGFRDDAIDLVRALAREINANRATYDDARRELFERSICARRAAGG